MPEGPEIRSAANFINKISENNTFTGPIVRGPLAVKLPTVDFSAETYALLAEARGKELKVHINDLSSGDTKKTSSSVGGDAVKSLLFHFGMSGCFKFTSVAEIPKHAHLQFTTKDKQNVLSFVDYRRFGTWKINHDWGVDRGPDPVTEYQTFRANVLANLEDPCFNRAICEVMLNQKYFNGIGNYLRAEILFRLNIPPFEVARVILQPIKDSEEVGVKREEPDLLDLCHALPLEVIGLGAGKGYDVDHDDDDYSAFNNWLQCYNKEGMKNLADKNGRTIWFKGNPGSLKPANAKVRARVVYKSKVKKEKSDEDQSQMNGDILKTEGDQPVKTENDVDISVKPENEVDQPVKTKRSRRKQVGPVEASVEIQSSHQKMAENGETVEKKKRKTSSEVKTSTKPPGQKAEKKLSVKCSNVEKVLPDRRSLRNRK